MIALIAALLALAQTPSPQLVDQHGHAFTLASLRGRPAVVTFVSAHCTDACPLVNAQFARASRALALQRIDARLVTITLDPANDPPSLMGALAKRFEADPRYWLVASGKAADVDAILRRFGVIAITGKSGYRQAHTTFVYVLDGSGTLSRTMMASTDLSRDVVDALSRLTGAQR